MLKVTLKTGVIGATERQKQTVLGLGLKYREATRTLKDTPAIRGMVNKVAHLVSVVKEDEKKSPLHLVPEYELGAISEQKNSVKKSSSKQVSETAKEEHHKKSETTSKKEHAGAKAKSKTKPHKKAVVARSHKTTVKKSGGKGKKS